MTGPLRHIRTFTGKQLDLFDIRAQDIDIVDIAHHLACTNRFGGATKRPINVAQHSVFVARLCDDLNCELQALLHDASEAYIGDVTKWLKNIDDMKPYRDLEKKIQDVIYTKFKCSTEQCPHIDDADSIMVRFEGMKGFGPDFKIDHPNYPALTPEEIKRVGGWGHWSWNISKETFLAAFRELTRDEDGYGFDDYRNRDY